MAPENSNSQIEGVDGVDGLGLDMEGGDLGLDEFGMGQEEAYGDEVEGQLDMDGSEFMQEELGTGDQMGF
jgi:hypothetical protein